MQQGFYVIKDPSNITEDPSNSKDSSNVTKDPSNIATRNLPILQQGSYQYYNKDSTYRWSTKDPTDYISKAPGINLTGNMYIMYVHIYDNFSRKKKDYFDKIPCNRFAMQLNFFNHPLGSSD